MTRKEGGGGAKEGEEEEESMRCVGEGIREG